jgi:phosphoserine phosphatase
MPLVLLQVVNKRGMQAVQDTIAVVFDFDDTLAPDTTSSFLESLGVDVKEFWSRRVQGRIEAGWDPVPAYLYEMIRISKSGDTRRRITKEKLSEFGRQVKFYNGATRLFSRLKKNAESANPNVSVEYYVISSAIGTLLRATSIVGHFEQIWASDFHYSPDGGIEFPCNIVSLTDKTRYVFHVSKGIFGRKFVGKPFEVNRKIPPQELRIPLDQIIFVGDGYTDIPCFSLVRKNGGSRHRGLRSKAPGEVGKGVGFHRGRPGFQPCARGLRLKISPFQFLDHGGRKHRQQDHPQKDLVSRLICVGGAQRAHKTG